MKKLIQRPINVYKDTKKEFDMIKKYNGWTADFFLNKLLEKWKDDK